MGGSGQSIISKEDMEAYKQLTYFTEAEIKNCLQKFSELLDPNTPFKSVHDPQARVLHDNVVNGLQELKVNPFAKRICEVFSPSPGQLMTFEEFLDMLSSLSVATPPTVRAEWPSRYLTRMATNFLGRTTSGGLWTLSLVRMKQLTRVSERRSDRRLSEMSSRRRTS